MLKQTFNTLYKELNLMSGREKGKTSIRTALQQRDAALYHRLETIWTAIAREIQEWQKSKEGHQQGPLHCGMVEEDTI
jgi:hypothetical protein